MRIDPTGEAGEEVVLAAPLLTITAPAWFVPAAIAGGIAYIGFKSYDMYKEYKSHQEKTTVAPAAPQGTKTLDDRKKDIYKDATRNPDTTSSGKKTEHRDKIGNIDQAQKDFDKLNPTDVRPMKEKGQEGGRIGTLDDGSTVVVRPKSREGSPTLEVQPPKGSEKPKEKTRYKPEEK